MTANHRPNPHASDEVTWEKILDLLDPTRPIDKFSPKSEDENGKVEKLVWLQRQWRSGMGSGEGEWIKQYGKAGVDLRAFNIAERNMVESLKSLSDCCYQKVESYDRNSKFLDAEGGQAPYISITHMGPTVFDWCRWPVRASQAGAKHRNLFALPGNFIRLALAGLKTLRKIHDKGFRHLDFRLPNFCLSTNGMPAVTGAGNEETLSVTIDWQYLKAIDFGFSITVGATPYTLLPELQEATKATQALIAQVKSIGAKKFAAMTPAERTLYAANDFDEIKHKPTFWIEQCPGALDKLRNIDWREDYHQFGKALRAVRAMSGLAANIDTEPFGLIDDVQWAIKTLPEALIAYGESFGEFPERDSLEAQKKQKEYDIVFRNFTSRLTNAIACVPADFKTDKILIRRADIEKPASPALNTRETPLRRAEAPPDQPNFVLVEPHSPAAAKPTPARTPPPAGSSPRTANQPGGGPAADRSRVAGPNPGPRPGAQGTATPPPKPPRAPRWKFTSLSTPARRGLLAALLVIPVVATISTTINRPQPPEAERKTPPPSTPTPVAATPAATPAPTPAPEASAPAATAAVPPAPPAPPTPLDLWRQQAEEMEKSVWWRASPGQRPEPTAAQLAWARETRRLAQEHGELDTLIDSAALSCSGRAAPAVPADSADCGRQMSAVLTHGNLVPASQSALFEKIAVMVDKRIYNPPASQAADAVLADTLLPGLRERQQVYAPFAYYSAYIQGCVQQPPRLAAALNDLNDLFERWPDSKVAAAARQRRWQERLQQGKDLCHDA